MKQTKKLFSMLMVMLMVLTSMSFNAFAAKAPTPTTAAFVASDVDSGEITGVNTAMQYSLDGGLSYEDVDDDQGQVLSSGVTATHGIRVIAKGTGGLENSDPQIITVTQHPNLNASDFTPVAPTTSANNDGKITGVSNAMEYRIGGNPFTAISGNEITGITGNTVVQIRMKASGSTLASQIPAVVRVPAFTSLPPAATPSLVFTGLTEDKGELTGFNGTDQFKYSLDNVSWTPVDLSDVKAELTGLSETSVIRVVRVGTSGNSDSNPQIINVGREATPTGITTTNASTNSANDGKIQNVSALMEYKKATDTAWTAGTGSDITVPAGTYHVRTKGSVGKLASNNYIATVGSSNSAISGTVSVTGTLKYNEQLTASFQGGPNTNLTYKWFRDTTEISTASGTTYTTVEADIGKTITVKVTSTDATGDVSGSTSGPIEKADGPTQAPTGLQGVEPSSTSSNDGQITGTEAGMEYATADTFASATDISGDTVNGLAPNTYYVRVKATNTHKAGAHAQVVVPARANLTGSESIEGTAKFGQVVTAKLENANSDQSVLTYQWKRDGANIPSETNATYTLAEADINHTISVEIGSTNRPGTKTATMSAPVEKADGPAAPQGITTTPPTSAGGSDGTITGVTNDMEYSTDPTFMTTTQISTAPTIAGVSAGTYYVRLKATNTHKAGEKTEVIVHPHGTQQIDGTVAISGTEKFNQILTATVSGTTSNASALVYKWYREGSEVGTGSTYTTVIADINKTLTVKVTDANKSGELTATSGNIAKADGAALPTPNPSGEAPTAPTGNGKIINVSPTMEVAKNDAFTQDRQDVTGAEIELAPGTYYVRNKETQTNLAGPHIQVVVPAYSAPTPGGLTGTASITPAGTPKFGDTLTAALAGGNSTNLTYKWFRGTTEISGATQSTYQLVQADIGQAIKVVIGANDKTGTIESPATAPVELADGPAAPTATGSAPIAASGQGKIANVTDLMEYKLASDPNWTAVPNGVTEVSVAPGNYEVRVKETQTHKAGAVQTVTVPVYSAPVPLTGTATIIPSGTPKFGDTLTATLVGGNGTNPTYKWFRGTTEIPGATQSTYQLVADDIGQAIKVEIKDAVNTGEITSTATPNVEKADGPAATGVSGVAPTVAGGQGKLNGVADTMEYKLASSSSWIAVPTGVTEVNVDSDTYEVRVKETNTHKAGATRTVVVPAFGTPVVPDITGTVTITGEAKFGQTLTATFAGTPNTNLTYKWYRGSVEIATGTTYAPVQADIGQVLTVKVTSTDANPASEVTGTTAAIALADGPTAPPAGITADAPTTSTGQGTINGVNDTMEYSTDPTFASATPVPTGITSLTLPAGTYYIRVKETATTAAGPSTMVTIPAYAAPSTGGGSGYLSPVRPDGVSQPATSKPTELKNGESKLVIGEKTVETMKNGKAETITMDAAPFIQNGRTMVPLRYVAELLGLKVEWVPQTKTSKLTGENIEILVPINKTTMTVNGKAVESDTMPVLTGNRTYLSISNIAKALGLEEGKNIVWNNTTKEVIIKK